GGGAACTCPGLRRRRGRSRPTGGRGAPSRLHGRGDVPLGVRRRVLDRSCPHPSQRPLRIAGSPPVSPLADPDRLRELATKPVHLALRQAKAAPEQRAARRLAAAATVPAPGAPRVLILTPRDWTVTVMWDAVLAQALRLRGADVRFARCGGGLEICD